MDTPPPDPAATDSKTDTGIKKRSLSFGGLRPLVTRNSDGNKSDSGSITGGGGGGKIKGFFNLKTKKKSSDNSISSGTKATTMSSGDDDASSLAEAEPDTALASLSLSKTKSIPKLETIPQSQPGSEILQKSTSSRTQKGTVQSVDPFRQAVTDAETAIDKLTTAYTVLSSIAQLASVAQELLPGVGAAVGILANMLKSARVAAVNKVAALRLVERCATILLAVQQAMIDTQGQVTRAMKVNIERLLQNLHNVAALLSRLSVKPFFEQYFKADEYARQILKAGEDLSDFVQIFELQTQIDVAVWRQQMVVDREKDVQLLTNKLQGIMDRGGDIIHIMEIQREQQQEAIAALQRRVDQIATMQIEEIDRHHSTIVVRPIESAPEPAEQLGRVSSETATGLGLEISTTTATSSELETRSMSPLGDVPPPRGAELERRFSAGNRAFEERALAALRRVSGDTENAVPDWVITFLEVSRHERIKTGFFSEVWRGSWQGVPVAVKQLDATADKKLFIKEVDVWRRLRSPFILPFYGASSATGPPPWQLISPYMRNGNIVDYLQTPAGKRCEKIALVHQMALGMEYLHSRDIIHGDLKAANVLVNDTGNINICDFGLSQLKLDMKRKSKDTRDDSEKGTMRWLSPERMKGGPLTWKCDVYSFGMVIYEVYTEGSIPLDHVNDKAFRKDIMKGVRPTRPSGMPDNLWSLTEQCWAQDPKLRPTFSAISKQIESMYHPREALRKDTSHTASTESSENDTVWATASEGSSEEDQHVISPLPNVRMLPESSEETSSSNSSLRSIPAHLDDEPCNESDRAEKFYRHYLSHEFDDRLSVALWFPTPVDLGEVGYVRHGQFVKLLSSHQPPTHLNEMPPMPYMDEFSSLQVASIPINVRSGLEKNLDRFVAWTKFVKSSGETAQKPIARHLDFPLKPGRKQAALVVEEAQFEIYKSFDEARCYLMANIDWIMKHYGDSHQIKREDIVIIVGSLSAQHYAMVVSEFSPRTTLKFNVHTEAARGPGEPWGTWSFVKQDGLGSPRVSSSRLLASPPNSPGSPKGSLIGPLPRPGVEDRRVQYTCKVSNVSASPRDAVLLAKLRIAPGETDPTLYP